MTESYYDQIVSYLKSGGSVMVPLVILAMFLWYAIGFRLYTLRKGTSLTVRQTVERYRQNPALKPRGIIDGAVVMGLSILESQPGNARRLLDEAFSCFDLEMDRFSVLMPAIVAAAPLLGLLGTVSGMIETFDSLGDMSLFSQSGGIAGGISLALFTTQMGLAVAIPGLLIGRILDNQKRSIALELQKLKDVLCAQNESGEL